MIEAVVDGYRRTASRTGRAAPSAAVLAALRQVPREAFVRPGDVPSAYENRPLPIGHGQTISQPYVVALMADLVRPAPDSIALEIGTGCGYAAAVLSCCVRHVHSVESIVPLAAAARERLARLGYGNVSVCHGDGYAGWPEHAPYDAIVVTAAAPEIPAALTDQLACGGRMVLPVGRPRREQELIVVERQADGALVETPVLPVAFVPMLPTTPPKDP